VQVERYAVLVERMFSVMDDRWKEYAARWTLRSKAWPKQVRVTAFLFFVLVACACCAYVVWNAFQ
jgi:hypothetical protein